MNTTTDIRDLPCTCLDHVLPTCHYHNALEKQTSFASEGDQLVSAILKQPADNTVQLAYADWLEENVTKVECKECHGAGCKPRGYCDAFMYSCDELGDDNCEHKRELITCGKCSGSGQVSNGYLEQAKLIRDRIKEGV